MEVNSIKKKIFKLGLPLFLASTTAYAADSGCYIEGQLIYLKDLSTQEKPSENSNAATGFLFSEYKPNGSSRFALGFQFNDRGAIEIGYLQLNQILPNSWIPATISDKNTKFHIDAVNIVAKSILPLDPARSVYAKLGGSYLINFAKAQDSATQAAASSINKPEKVSLTFSIGGSAEITDKLQIDIAWTWVFAPNLLFPSMVDPVNFLAIGARFHLN